MSIVLFEEKSKCCGCGACMNACPHNAISMKADEHGFVYPEIQREKCVECGACTRACGYQKDVGANVPLACWAAVAKDPSIVNGSSSGGVFAVLALNVLRKGGVVYGAAQSETDDARSIQHIRIEAQERLHLLQGSKYVQSAMNDVFRQVKRDLETKRDVLFSGTPCQVAGLRAYLGRKYERLLTVDVICHGVPSERMFQDFLQLQEKRQNIRITRFAFRHKERGRIKNVAVQCRMSDGSTKRIVRGLHGYSYLHLFMEGYIFRESCYQCPFASERRASDITLGDYWSFCEEHPTVKKDTLNDTNGVSCVLLNTEAGQAAFVGCQPQMMTLETTFDKIARHNEQLRRPSHKPTGREELLRDYQACGYEGMEAYYRRKCIKRRLVCGMKDLAPSSLKRLIRRAKGTLRAHGK